jgi:fumarate reductase subunit C
MTVRLYVWQRATAALMVPLVLVHIVVIFYATRQGLSAADILSRTHDSLAWAAFYGVFVAAASVHAAIGVRNVLTEWSPLTERGSSFAGVALGLLLAVLGSHAIMALVLT